MIPETWDKNPAYIAAAAAAVGDRRAWQSEGFQTLLDLLVGSQELEGEEEVSGEWVLEISKLVKQVRKDDRKDGRWIEIPARKRWIALAGRALIAMHNLTATPKPTAGYHGE
jgi:hypothetical protein